MWLVIRAGTVSCQTSLEQPSPGINKIGLPFSPTFFTENGDCPNVDSGKISKREVIKTFLIVKKIDFKLKISLVSTLAKFQTKSLYYLFKVLFGNRSEFFFFVFQTLEKDKLIAGTNVILLRI